MNPTLPADEIAILKQQHLQDVHAAEGVAAVPREPRRSAARCSAIIRTRGPARPKRRCRRWIARRSRRSTATHYRPNNAFLLIVGAVDPDAMIAAVEKAFGGWARGDVPKPAFPAPPALDRPPRRTSCSGRTASSRRSRVGNIAVKRERSALVRAVAGQHDLRRRVQLAHRAEHPRGEGLHLFAAVGAHRLRRRRLLPIRRRRPQRGDRRDADRGVQGNRQDACRGQRRRASCRARKAYLRGIFPIQTATQTGLAGDAEQRLRLRAAEGLSGNVPREDRGRHAGAGEERRRRRCSARRIP